MWAKYIGGPIFGNCNLHRSQITLQQLLGNWEKGAVRGCHTWELLISCPPNCSQKGITADITLCSSFLEKHPHPLLQSSHQCPRLHQLPLDSREPLTAPFAGPISHRPKWWSSTGTCSARASKNPLLHITTWKSILSLGETKEEEGKEERQRTEEQRQIRESRWREGSKREHRLWFLPTPEAQG